MFLTILSQPTGFEGNHLRKRTTSRGTVYLLVLVASVIVTLIGLMGHRMQQASLKVASSDIERNEAMVLAESAIQWGTHIVTLKDDWRESIVSGVPIQTATFGAGKFELTISDTDGDLSDDPSDPFTMTGVGRVGNAVQSLSVEISNASTSPHPALSYSIVAGGAFVAESGIVSTQEGGTAVRQQTSSATRISPEPLTTVPESSLPSPSLIADWAALGTVITSDLHGGLIDGERFSHVKAPFGVTPNPAEIYVIDAGGNDLTISDTTLCGTIIITNLAGSQLNLANCSTKFGDHGGPTIICDGDLRYEVRNKFVHQGLWYVDGDLTIAGGLVHVGALMATGSITVDPSVAYLTVNSHASATDPTPLGFTLSDGFSVTPGSFERVVR